MVIREWQEPSLFQELELFSEAPCRRHWTEQLISSKMQLAPQTNTSRTRKQETLSSSILAKLLIHSFNSLPIARLQILTYFIQGAGACWFCHGTGLGYNAAQNPRSTKSGPPMFTCCHQGLRSSLQVLAKPAATSARLATGSSIQTKNFRLGSALPTSFPTHDSHPVPWSSTPGSFRLTTLQLWDT